MEALLSDFNSKKIDCKKFLSQLDGMKDDTEKLNYMLSEALITPDDFCYRKLILNHPEVLTAHERQPQHSFLMKDVNKTLGSMKSKLRVHSRFEYPELVNFRIPKNYEEINVKPKLERHQFIFRNLKEFCQLLIDLYEYPYYATDLYFGEEFWISEDNSDCSVIRDTEYISGTFKSRGLPHY